MALDTERRSLGVKSLLRRLRGVAPHPVSAEDTMEGLFHPETEDEEELKPQGESAPPGALKAPGKGDSGGNSMPSSGRSVLSARRAT